MFPKLFSIGSFSVPTYGVLVALGFLAGLFIALRLGKRIGLPSEPLTNLALYCALGGIVGAKLFMFMFDWQYYRQNPHEIFSLSTLQAAGVFHGGFIAALLVAVYYIRQQRLPFWQTLDCFAPGIALGHAIGRIGCFAAGCCWGRQCDLPWGVRFHTDQAAPVPLDVPLHPAQLYESAANLLIFALLYRLFQHRQRPGQIFGLYLVLYSTARFVVEFYRNHEQSLIAGLSLTQWIAAGLFVLGVAVLSRSRQTAFVAQHQ